MLEPGLDRHEWQARWEQLEDDLGTSPAETLPELDRLVHEMLKARGFDVDDPVAREGDDRDVVAEFLAARDTTRLLEQGVEDVSPGDVGAAVNGYRALYDFLLEERTAP